MNGFLNQRSRNCVVTGPMIKAKAISESQRLYPERGSNAFNASDGWPILRKSMAFGIQKYAVKFSPVILPKSRGSFTNFAR